MLAHHKMQVSARQRKRGGGLEIRERERWRVRDQRERERGGGLEIRERERGVEG